MEDILALIPAGFPREALWLLVIPALALVAKLAQLGKRVVKDPQRGFSGLQKDAGHRRASRRCEMDNWLFMRCRRASEHADHHYPHARGGASSINNLVAACAPHNLRKSAKMPTKLASWRIQHRRKRYFPVTEYMIPGQWFDPRNHG